MLQQKNRNLIVNSVVIKGNKQKINKMKRFFKHIFLFMFLIISALMSSAQISDDIITCFKTGNSAKLSSFFNDNIELVVLENENVLSKSHAITQKAITVRRIGLWLYFFSQVFG